MSNRSTFIRPPTLVHFVLAAAASSYACGGSPADVALGTPTAVADGGADDASPSPDAGALPGVDAGSLEAGACGPGRADCDGDPTNGCETNLTDDPLSCGSCGHDCAALPHVSGSGATCHAGTCEIPASACAAGWAHCSSNPNDGCEADLGSPQTCGSCTTQCSGATPDCSGGACTNGCASSAPTSCSGSCVDTTSSATNCGTCGNVCPAPAYSTASCAMSTCEFTCNAGHHTCGSTCADDTSPATCGSSCTPCAAPAGGTATCTAQGACGFACDSGFHTCDGATCSSNTSTATCGASCTPCAAPASNGTATCDGTSCGIACDAGYHLCGGNACDANNSVSSCGSSCTPCPTPANAVPTCNGTACGFTCNAGYADCDGNPANGCEVNLTDDGNNCNACGHSCLGGACSGSVCQPVVLANAFGPSNLVLDAQNVYFDYLNGPDEVIGAVPKVGGPLASSVGFMYGITALALVGTEVYMVDTSGALDSIATTDVSGAYIDRVLTGAQATSQSTLAMSGVRPFWSGSGGVDSSPEWIETTYQPAGNPPPALQGQTSYYGGGAVIDQLTGAPDGYLAWFEVASASTRLAGAFPAEVGSTPAWGLTPVTIATLSSEPQALFLDATYVYYYQSGAITTLTRGGTVARVSSPIADTSVSSLVVDGTVAYWISGRTQIHSTPIAGGATAVVARGTNIHQVAIDSSAIYWTDSSAGTVTKLAK